MILPILLLAIALLLFWESRRRQRSAGIPGGRLTYSDTRAWGPVEKPLYDANLGLVGKPDYLVAKGEHIIPIEVKSSIPSSGPYDAHIFQLAAYCLLVQTVLGKRPPYGILHYTDRSRKSRTYAIDFTPQLEAALLDLLEEMRAQVRLSDIPRSHDAAARCSGCGYRSICDQRL